ncbi:CRTAC1 family protein [Zobellia russellii]|uniref:CRTAC1 family protein n=1 Tax=Zobellia russellii TaxID=248907 RepID=UPI001BFF5EB9|nr:CRTAC1 family protein [Zobellia russellii]MBT9189573.1 CRTAC1 family protein [Zobellia russellii]
MSAQDTGIEFSNNLQRDSKFDIFSYRNYYNGGGVAIGDINNDGLADIYFTANRTSNKLYLNQGGFRFKDITEQAGVGGKQAWSTGVGFADVNNDGFLDIYVCNSGDVQGDNKANELFINNGTTGSINEVRFTESADMYGVDDKGYSTHSAFFDYDNDGDLDLYLLNNSSTPIVDFIKHGYKNTRNERDALGGDKMLRNDDGVFRDVTEEAGIFGSQIGFGLGVSVGDINKDGWLDIYVSNDFFERDYLYINQKDGTFSEELMDRMGHISTFSMGADMADIDNDGFPDVFVTDMLPDDEIRFKKLVGYEPYDVHQNKIKQGYYHQYMRNMLHWNIPAPNAAGDKDHRVFAEVGQMANVQSSDWSWGGLIADFDNDGLKDIFVDNGIYKDITNRDFIDFFANEESALYHQTEPESKIDFNDLLDKMPSAKLVNHLYINQGGKRFEERAKESGINDMTFSNGSAYGDLDNDGDLDLVVNNVNMLASIYRNNATDLSVNNYLGVKLKMKGANMYAIGAKVTLYTGERVLFQELVPSRGYQSSSDYKLIFGLGKCSKIDSLKIVWPDATRQMSFDIAANQVLNVDYKKEAVVHPKIKANRLSGPLFKEVGLEELSSYDHQEDEFVDFYYERLIPHKISTEGPAFAGADVNNDGVKDFFIGGAKGFPPKLYLSNKRGYFSSNRDVLENEKMYEDTAAEFFDFDGDGDFDLYVGSGGNQYPYHASNLIDRLYINNGKGQFVKSKGLLPEFPNVTSVVRASDLDGDGDVDLFVGSRVVPGKYGETPRSVLLINEGGEKFTESTSQISFNLGRVGMVTDAVWSDYDGDGDDDLILVGEWMGIKVFNNNEGSLSDRSKSIGLENTEGWWNTIHADDIDMDGDIDLIAGNRGENSFLKASQEAPLKLYMNDFDKNGSWEGVIGYGKNGKSYPLPLKNELTEQITGLKKKYVKFEDYAGQTMEQVFTEEQLKFSISKEVKNFSSIILVNEGQRFRPCTLPYEAQVSPINTVHTEDFNNDGIKDLMLGGNFFGPPSKFGRFDASYGQILLGKGDMTYKALDASQSGFFHKGVVQGMDTLHRNGKRYYVLVFNNEPLKVYELLKRE